MFNIVQLDLLRFLNSPFYQPEYYYGSPTMLTMRKCNI